MHKAISAATLFLAASAFVGNKPADATPSGLSSPVILARVARIGQTANITSTTLFTPRATGMYRINEYIVETAPVSGSNAAWDLSLEWTDETGPEIGAGTTVGAGLIGPGTDGTRSPGGTAIIEAVAGQPVTYSVGLEGQDSGGTYSVYLTVEKL